MIKGRGGTRHRRDHVHKELRTQGEDGIRFEDFGSLKQDTTQ